MRMHLYANPSYWYWAPGTFPRQHCLHHGMITDTGSGQTADEGGSGNHNGDRNLLFFTQQRRESRDERPDASEASDVIESPSRWPKTRPLPCQAHSQVSSDSRSELNSPLSIKRLDFHSNHQSELIVITQTTIWSIVTPCFYETARSR
jgi:hypothetical protein